jgi:GNAT superfamily N-acetyltransferase
VRAERAALEALYFAPSRPRPYVESIAEARAFGALAVRDSTRPGYLAFVARSPDHVPVGIVYGYDTPALRPDGPWWARLLDSVGDEASREWILGQFAFCWFAVAPEAQGTGVGAALYDAVLEQVRAPRAWLVTHGEASTARGMYDRRGWERAGPGGARVGAGRAAVLGLRVPRVATV